MSDVVEYKVLQCKTNEGTRTALVETSSYESDGLSPCDYFAHPQDQGNVVGTVQIEGDIDELDDIYIGD